MHDKKLSALDAGATVEEPVVLETEGPAEEFEEIFDRTTGVALDQKLVKAGRSEEMS